jgi:putative transposase
MIRWLGIVLGTLRSAGRRHRELALENLALRQQLAVWKSRQPRPRLTEMDRIFWVFLSRVWTSWRHSLHVVRPETVVRWHRQGFRRYWAWKSRRRSGRPVISTGPPRSDSTDESRQSALGCAKDPRRVAEAGRDGLAGDDFEIHAPASAAAVANVAHVFEEPRPGSDRARFLRRAHGDLSSPVRLRGAEPRSAPAGAFQCHGASERGWTARQLLEACGLEGSPRYLIRDRDQVYGERFSHQARILNLQQAVIAPRSPWQNAYAERVIGSIRRECLDHVVVIGERHLRGILSTYVDYYNGSRTHLSLGKDAPEPRTVQRPTEAGWSRCRASVDCITNTSGGRREPDRTNK